MGAVILISSSAQAQNLFEPDSGTNNIYKFTPNGHRSIFASGLSNPNALAFDSAGNLFEMDYAGGQMGSGHIYKFTSTGHRSIFASGLWGPIFLAFDSAGNLFVTDSGTNNIYKFTPNGVQSTFAPLDSPGGLAFDSAGNLFVTGFNSNSIYKFTPGGVRSTFASGLDGPGGLAFDSAGNLFEADNLSGKIYRFTPGRVRSTFASGLSSPSFVAFAPPLITSPRAATATLGQLFVYQITATDNPTSFGATPLPAGLTFDSGSGILGGTPTNSGPTQIQLSASNSPGPDLGTRTATLMLTVQAPPSGPVIISGTSITARTGDPFSFEVFTIGGSATARLSAIDLPPGLSADSVTGVISGTPTADGSFGVTLTVRDGAATNTSTLQLTFTSDPAIPVITSVREVTLAAGQFFRYTIDAPSSDHSGTTFSLIGNLPLGLSLNAATGTISGTYNPGFQNGGALLGNVQLVAKNSSGNATCPLAFFPQVPGTAVNISTRVAVGTGDNVLIGGFIVTGNAPKNVIVRAIGPELTARGVPGALQDPTLELLDHTGTRIAYNDNWMDAPNQQKISSSGLAPTDYRESAMLVTLAQNNGNPGSLTGHYTTIVRGKNETTGAASVEVYDLGTASFDVLSNAQLANISTRGMIQTGDNVMIGGFIVRGDMPATVIVRAIGPSLAQHGITNPLQDPTLELHDHNGMLIAYNDNWMGAPNRQAIINSGLAPSNNLESAILRSLRPGNYTAVVRGRNGTTGIALVEAYVMP